MDTHAWLWCLDDPARLSRRAVKLVERGMVGDALYVSSISAWEVALLEAKGRLRLTIPAAEWIARTETLPFFRFVPVDNAIALKSVSLPAPLHDDPADRIIIATALALGFPLLTKDQRIQDYVPLPTVW